jgi:hypothetical protein
MSGVQVNNAKGEPLTKIVSGETASQAKERISERVDGILENSDGVALSAGDRITAEGAPYVFKPLQQQQQVDTVPEEYKQLAAFAKEEMDNRTKHKPMSEASVPFAEEILKGYGFTVAVDPFITECGSGADPPPYSWKNVDGKSKEWKKGEHAGTPGARDWVRDNLLGDDTTFSLKVVTGSMLPKVKANRRSASGKGDLAIGDPLSMNYGEEYLFANGLVELKTDEFPLKTGQSLLQLLALSMISRFKTGVALLATDCHTKWETFHFSNGRTVQRRIYQHGRKAWEDFMELLKSPGTRVFKIKTDLIDEEDEQNLDGFNFGDRESKKMKAMQDEALLERMADHLGHVYGERPVVPLWARAESRVPDYYV